MNMIKHTMALALTLTAVTLPAAAQAATVVTNLDTNATWTVKNLTTNVVTNAVVPGTVPSSYNGGSSNPSVNGARWIYPSAGTTAAPDTTFAFTKIFSLPDFVTTSLLTGSYWSDNGIVSILLNGVAIFGPVAITPALGNAQGFGSATGTALSYSGTAFQTGLNTLVFNVRNGPGGSRNPVALRADFQVATAVPEPGTWMLMLLGFGAIGFAMRSRAKTQVRFQFA
jgi:PEP-CTERM motif